MESCQCRLGHLLDRFAADITQAAELKLAAAQHDFLALVVALSILRRTSLVCSCALTFYELGTVSIALGVMANDLHFETSARTKLTGSSTPPRHSRSIVCAFLVDRSHGLCFFLLAHSMRWIHTLTGI